MNPIDLAPRRWLSRRDDLPFFRRVERRGLTLVQVEEAVGMNELARALRRCAACVERPRCGRRTAACPNDGVIRGALGESA